MSDREAPAPTLDEKLQRAVETGGRAKATARELGLMSGSLRVTAEDPKGPITITRVPWGLRGWGEKEVWSRTAERKGSEAVFEKQ